MIFTKQRSYRSKFSCISISSIFSFPNYIREKVFDNCDDHFFTNFTLMSHLFNCYIFSALIYRIWWDYFIEKKIWFGLANGLFAIISFLFEFSKKFSFSGNNNGILKFISPFILWILFLKDNFLNTGLFKLSIASTILSAFFTLLGNNDILQFPILFTFIYHVFSLVGMISSIIYFFGIISNNLAPRPSEADVKDIHYNSLFHKMVVYLYQYYLFPPDSELIEELELIFTEILSYGQQITQIGNNQIQVSWNQFTQHLNSLRSYIIMHQNTPSFYRELIQLISEENVFMTQLNLFRNPIPLNNINYITLKDLKEVEKIMSFDEVDPLNVILQFNNQQPCIIPYDVFAANIHITHPLGLLQKNYIYSSFSFSLGFTDYDGVLKYIYGTI